MKKLTCGRCGYSWLPRIEPSLVKNCPGCKQSINKHHVEKDMRRKENKEVKIENGEVKENENILNNI
jgi:NAD-dependent SIR2 family protein deacetylase